ncbi:MAG: AAA family ATPase [Chloroflexota bacterium]|nr:AAA family ATPase [Chloroflexota bacterium]MDE2921226.1 AAA family ATPase [Chloroflexota bacterium]
MASMESDLRRQAHMRRSPITFVREHWRAILLYLGLTGLLVFGLTNASEITLGILSFAFTLVYAMMFMVVQFGFLFYILGRGRVYWIQPGETGVYFSDYRGNDQVLEVARRVVRLLQGAMSFKRMGGEVTRGVLLEGPPGTGKSYLAQVIANEAGIPFAYASAPGFQNMFMGIGNLRVRMLYGKARKLARKHGAAIIFIDEIDAIGMARAGQTGGGMMMGGLFGGGAGFGLLNELLLQMDPPNFDNGWFARLLRTIGLRRTKAMPPLVLTMGATNLASALDHALLRPGRFDRKIHVDLPDLDGRKDIIEYYLAKVRHEDMPVDRMANDTILYTPVAIKFVINEAVIHAHFDGRDAISYDDFTRARENHEWGLREPIRGLTEEDRRRLAYHEAGHAIAQVKLKDWERLTKVTIIRHGDALGLAAWKPVEEKRVLIREELLASIQVSLASRAAEELFLGSQTLGVTSDFAGATHLAFQMLSFWGMDGSFYSSLPFGPMVDANDPRMKRKIDQVLEQEYRKVKGLLSEYSGAVHELAQELIANDEVDGQDVEDMVQRWDEQIAEGNRLKALPEGGVLVGADAEPQPYSYGGNGNGSDGRNGHSEERPSRSRRGTRLRDRYGTRGARDT